MRIKTSFTREEIHRVLQTSWGSAAAGYSESGNIPRISQQSRKCPLSGKRLVTAAPLRITPATHSIIYSIIQQTIILAQPETLSVHSKKSFTSAWLSPGGTLVIASILLDLAGFTNASNPGGSGENSEGKCSSNLQDYLHNVSYDGAGQECRPGQGRPGRDHCHFLGRAKTKSGRTMLDEVRPGSTALPATACEDPPPQIM